MGGNSSTLDVEHRIWNKGSNHETGSNIFEREDALSSYQNREHLSFGKADPKILKEHFDDNFFIVEKTDKYYDGYRKTYSDQLHEEAKVLCCLSEGI